MKLLSLALTLSLTVSLTALAYGQNWRELTIEDTDVLAGEWVVQDDVLVGRAAPGETAWLLSKQPYADFELELEFKTPAPANGGVQIRAHWMPALPIPDGVTPVEAPRTMYGYQVTIDTADKKGTAAVLDQHGAAPLVTPCPDAQKAVNLTDWNALRIVCRGPVIETAVNGVIANRVYDEGMIGGRLALQVASTGSAPAEVHYRGVRVNDLGRLGAWRALFNGADLDGWAEWGAEEWSVEDGAIVGRSGPKKSEGYLATKETWKDFRVRGAFKMLGEGNFGLFYHSTVKFKDDGYPVISGIQGEVEPNYPSETGGLYESYRRGWLVQTDKTGPGAFALRPGEWNEIEIRSQGNHVTTWVNGVRAVDFRDTAPQLFEGAFALQLHTGGVDGIAWKDLQALDVP